jgi:hypothetical protein
MGRPTAANAVAYRECVWTTPLTSGRCRYTYRWLAVSEEGACWPSTTVPSRSTTTMDAAVSSPYRTPEA